MREDGQHPDQKDAELGPVLQQTCQHQLAEGVLGSEVEVVQQGTAFSREALRRLGRSLCLPLVFAMAAAQVAGLACSTRWRRCCQD